MPANTTQGYPYPLPTEPVAEGAQAIRNLAESLKGWQCIGEKAHDGSGDAFAAIPQTFDHLRLIVRARTVLSIKADDLAMRLNGYTGNQYFRNNLGITNNVVAGGQAIAETFARLGAIPGSQATANFWGISEVLFPFYSDATMPKCWTGLNHCHAPVSSNPTDLSLNILAGTWNQNGGITSIQLFGGASGQLLATGSRVWLYGISGV